MSSEVRFLAMQHPQYPETVVVTAVCQTLVDFSQTTPAMRQQEQIDLVLVSIEMFRFQQEVCGFRCSADFEQGLDEWVESLECRGREQETLAWRLRLLEEWIRAGATGLVGRGEKRSLVQAGASKEMMCSFGRTLSQSIGCYWGMFCSNLHR